MSTTNKKNKEISNYKTIMCERWLQYSSCNHGKNCAFAHGEGELRKAIICPSYAHSKICNSTVCDLLHIDVGNIEQVFDELYYTIQERNKLYHEKDDILLDLDDIQKERNDLAIEKEKIQKERDFLLNEQSKLIQNIFELQQQNNLLIASEIDNKLKCKILLEQVTMMQITQSSQLSDGNPQSSQISYGKPKLSSYNQTYNQTYNQSYNHPYPNNIPPVGLSGRKRQNMSDV